MDILDLKESLRFSIFNTDFMSIDPILLEDTALVKEVFQECDGLTLQAHFLARLDLEDILYLCKFDAITTCKNNNAEFVKN